MVWGGRRLGEVLGKPLPTAEAYGESWEISDHASHRSTVVDGPAAGRTLRDLMTQDAGRAARRCGEPRPAFPWLVKFLDACDWLSVQVHPDDESVRALWPGEGGKTEAWFVLDAAPTGKVYAGLLPGVDEARLRSRPAGGDRGRVPAPFPAAARRLPVPAGRHGPRRRRRRADGRGAADQRRHLPPVRLGPPRRPGPFADLAHRGSAGLHRLERRAGASGSRGGISEARRGAVAGTRAAAPRHLPLFHAGLRPRLPAVPGSAAAGCKY